MLTKVVNIEKKAYTLLVKFSLRTSLQSFYVTNILHVFAASFVNPITLPRQAQMMQMIVFNVMDLKAAKPFNFYE